MAIETIASTPLWNPGTLFEFGFETTDQGHWDQQNYGIITANPLDGAQSGRFNSLEFAFKRINRASSLYWRVMFQVTAIGGERVLVRIVNGAATAVELRFAATHGGQPNQLVLRIGAVDVARWPVDLAPHVFECHTNIATQTSSAWFDGNIVVSNCASPLSDNFYELTIGTNAAATTFFNADAIKVDSFRVGLPGPISPPNERTAHDIELDGVGYNLFQNQYQEQDISGFAPRLGTGDVSYSDLSGFQHLFIPSLHHGVGQTEMTGAGQGNISMSANSWRADITGVGVMRGWNAITLRGNLVVPAGLDNINTRITGDVVGSTAVFGLGFSSARPSAAYATLLVVPDTGATAVSFTSTWGVRDVLFNGAWTFVTLGGARMMRSADLTTWVNVGRDAAPPTDMGRMCMYNGFLWVADRTTPLLYRAGQTDASDLEKTSGFETRVGPGTVPINSLCPYLGKLYVGREDGLYHVTQDRDTVTAHVAETFPRSPYNCRDMVVHNGYLVYAVGSRIYRFSGESKQDITPGPVEPFFTPPVSIRHWLSLAISNGYLYAWGWTATNAYLLVYNGIGWHLADTTGTTEGYGLIGSMSIADEPRAYHVRTFNDAGTIRAHVNSHSSLLGQERPAVDSYAPLWRVTTPWYSLGMPSVPKLFRMVRILVDEFPTFVAGETPFIRVNGLVRSAQREQSFTAGSVMQRDCDFIMLPPGLLGNKIRLEIIGEHPASKPLIIRGIVLQYIDRPEPVWGYDMTLSLPNTQREYSAEPGQKNVHELKQHLRDARAKETYVRMRDRDGAICDGFISSGPRFNLIGGEAVARLTFMVVKRYIHTPAISGGPVITMLE